jgi:hypothetical protein
MNDICNDALNVAIALRCIKSPETSFSLSVCGVGRENGTTTLALGPDDATHLQTNNFVVDRNTQKLLLQQLLQYSHIQRDEGTMLFSSPE